jgi:hypothetical protein
MCMCLILSLLQIEAYWEDNCLFGSQRKRYKSGSILLQVSRLYRITDPIVAVKLLFHYLF